MTHTKEITEHMLHPIRTQPRTAVPKSLAHAVACALAATALVPLPANALFINTASVGFNNTASVTDAEGGGATTNNNASLGTSSVKQFDSSNGVLMGATLNLTSTRTQSITVNAAASANGSAQANKTTSGTGSSTANISAAGVNYTFSPAISADASCSGKKKDGCSSPTTPTTTSTNVNLAASSLDSYVGGSEVLVTRTAPTLTANQTANNFPGAESTNYSIQWAGTISATYDYLLHAVASFDGANQLTLNLDFGTVYLNDLVSDLGFSIFNAAGDRVGLDLDSILGSGDVTQLTTNLLSFTGLDAGSSNAYLASFDNSSLGSYAASYTLGLSDADVGVSSSRFGKDSLTLNLTGNVIQRQIQPPGSIPEPATLSLLGLGVAGIGYQRRKRVMKA